MRYLVGDIGGTNSRLAVYQDGELHHVHSQRNEGLSDPVKAYGDYARQFGPMDGACFGVAGPPIDGSVLMTNLGWTLRETTLAEELGCPVRLINDFHAQALAMPELPREHLVPLGNPPPIDQGHMAVIGAGTGLGEALLAWNGTDYTVVSGEGSHGRFAPKNPREIELLMALVKRWPDHVSVERVVSGPGLINVYDALRGDVPRHPKMSTEDPAAVITREGLNGDPLCAEILDIFVATLADEAASLALKCNATSVFISGGIPPRIMPLIEADFRRHFENKGRYRKNLERASLFVVKYGNTGLLGAGIGARQFFPA